MTLRVVASAHVGHRARRISSIGWPAAVRWLLAMGSGPSPALGTGRDALNVSAATNGGGEPGATLERIYRQHARTVMAYLYHRLPSVVDAEDALAEVFIAALSVCATGEVPGIGWLMVAARRRVADFYRKRDRQPAPITVESVAAQEQPDAAERAPEQVTLRLEERRELLALVARLPDDQQEVLALRFAAGLPSAEIAAIIGKSNQATRAILSRAVRRLRREWAQ